MVASPTDGMFLSYTIPLGLAQLIERVITGNQGDPNTPQIATPTASREWFSQPRPGSDTTTEVISVNFKLPLSISEVGWDNLRVTSTTEVWYQDRQNNWRQVLDESRIPVTLNVSYSTAASWYKAHFYCYPIVAKVLQFRITRVNDPQMGGRPYCVGLRNALIRRNIYTRSDGTQGIEPQQDALGNTFTSYIKDWDAAKAFDNDANTYWKSAPMPDPNAVTSMYLDCRDAGGNPQLIDTLYIDPVYTGQNLNLYYSTDDTVDVRKLSPITAVPTLDENTQWQQGQGRWDTGAEPPEVIGTPGTQGYDPGVSNYQFTMAWGPLVSQDTWFGIEWTPDFNAANAPSENPVLLQVNPSVPGTGQYWPKVYYDAGAGTIVLEMTNGTAVQSYVCPLTSAIVAGETLRIVVGWGYDPQQVYISVKTALGTDHGTLTQAASTFPALVTLDGSVGFHHFRGLFTAHVIKLENWTLGQLAFQANPQVYVSPDPVIPDPSGNIPATTLDNAIYAAAWVSQEHGTGGDHSTRYQDKTWTPIWQNYVTQRGKLYFPQQINLKYLKLEFTLLTEESYPVYDSGIQVSYNTFPASVTQTVTTHHPGLLGVGLGLLATTADVVLGSIQSVNFLNPSTINAAVNSVFGQVVTPVSVTVGQGAVTNSLPNTTNLDISNQTRNEVSSPWVYKRSPIDASTLAGQALLVATGQSHSQGIQPALTQIGAAVADSFEPLENFASNPTGLPQQGSDWWVFPGAALRLPAVIMNGLTAVTQTIFGRPDTTDRLRFNTTSIHRYDIKTATRDAAVAYFAGIREVQPYVTTYIDELDPVSFDFSSYDPSQWVLSSTVKALDSGPITTAGPVFPLINGNFDTDINNWLQAQGTWSWDDTQGHWFPGTATVTADGTLKALQSNLMTVAPGADIIASVWVKWSGLTVGANANGIRLTVLTYNNDTLVGQAATQGINYANWSTHATGDWTQIQLTYTVGSGINNVRLALEVPSASTAGQVWFDTVLIGTTDQVDATAYKAFTTTSTFAKVECTFTDSGVVRSDAMWAQIDPQDTNISSTALAYYTSTIPDQIPSGMWNDSFAAWDDPVITWGEPQQDVAISVDPNRLYDGKRVLHFTRVASTRRSTNDADEAGVKVRQSTNFVGGALFRIGCVFLKPTDNQNQVTLRLRRVSDGVYITPNPGGNGSLETFTPVVGYWYEYVSQFYEVPESNDQEYTVELVLTGDDADEFYLNDLYVELAHVRYFARLGDSSQPLHDITQLRYANSAIVSTTVPTNQMTVQLSIHSPAAYAYGASIKPIYLK